MTNDVLTTALNAMSNACRDPVSASDVPQILSTGEGPVPLVRALFGDCSVDTLDRLGATLGLSRADIREAYGRARRLHAAANADLDADG